MNGDQALDARQSESTFRRLAPPAKEAREPPSSPPLAKEPRFGVVFLEAPGSREIMGEPQPIKRKAMRRPMLSRKLKRKLRKVVQVLSKAWKAGRPLKSAGIFKKVSLKKSGKSRCAKTHFEITSNLFGKQLVEVGESPQKPSGSVSRNSDCPSDSPS